MFNLFNQGWVGLLGLIVGLIGLLLYFKGRIGARPTCQMRSLRLLGKEEQALPPEVEIHFKQKNIPRLTLTRVYLWNGGKESMRGSQIVQDDPLRCEFEPSDEILKAQVAACTRPFNKVTLQTPDARPYCVLIDFDYLDPADGARIDILHTSKLRYPKLHGSLRGIPKGVIRVISSPMSSFDLALQKLIRKPRLFYNVALVVGVIGILLGSLPTPWLQAVKGMMDIGSKHTPPNPISEFRYAALAVGCLYALFPLLAMWGRRKKYPAALDPDTEEKGSGEQSAAEIRPPAAAGRP